MRTSLLLLCLFLFSGLMRGQIQIKEEEKNTDLPIPYVDNNSYWRKMAKVGKAELNPVVKVMPAVYTGSVLRASCVVNRTTIDIPFFDESVYQSENSITVDPNNEFVVLNSNNSCPKPVDKFYGANYNVSMDGGNNWNGDEKGINGDNFGDPAVAINRDGRYFVGYINRDLGQSVNYSDDKGKTWTTVEVASIGVSNSAVLDKNHLWLDNAAESPYQGHIYNAWTPMRMTNDGQIVVSRSIDNGETWEDVIPISNDIEAVSHCQGVNLSTGPNGEVYAVYSVYDHFPAGENACGFSKSLDGGATWTSGKRILENISGIRNYSSLGKNMRVNSFPSMAVDVSDGPNNGNIYIAFSNIGVPGVSAGIATDIYLIVSKDQGETWSTPRKINQDEQANAQQYFPWICCDPETGVLSVVFYDDRNVGGNQVEVFCANSFDGGDTWDDFKVSDVAFTPSPIPGAATGYMGDYLSIYSQNGKVYPCWADNRSGTVMTYCSPYEIHLVNGPSDLIANLNEETGEVNLSWTCTPGDGFQHYAIYRNGEKVATSSETSYDEILTSYDYFEYKVYAIYEEDLMSVGEQALLKRGQVNIALASTVISHEMSSNETALFPFTVSNPGQLPLEYEFRLESIETKRSLSYCEANGGGDRRYIQRVRLADLDNTSEHSAYSDFSELKAHLEGGEDYELIVDVDKVTRKDYCATYIDWNNDGDFDDDKEFVLMENSPGYGPYKASIRVPHQRNSEDVRMRIRLAFGDLPPACGDVEKGETEDYTISYQNWLELSNTTFSLNGGEEETHQLKFNTNKLESGTYKMNLHISSNAAENSHLIVPVQLTVGENPFDIKASSSAEEVCEGSYVQLDVEVADAASCSFLWSSTPEGFTSTLKNPEVTVNHSTSYQVAVTKAEETAYASVAISSHPWPVIDLGGDKEAYQNEVVSIGTDEQEGVSYLWSNGATTPKIEVAYSGEEIDIYNLMATSAFGCSENDVVIIHWKEGVATAEVMVEDGFKLYPNPAKTKVSLAIFKELSNGASLQIFDMQGRCILTEDKLNGGEGHILDISQLPKGVYTFLLKSNGKYAQEKLIVQ